MIKINIWRLLFLILGTLVLFVLLFFELQDMIDFEIFLTYSIIYIFLNYWFYKSEKNKIMKLYLIYINDLEPEKYLQEFQKYNKHRLRNKTSRIIDQIYFAIVLIDACKVQEAHQILMNYVDEEPKFSAFLRFWYYNAWINYFDEVDDLPRMKVLALQIKNLINCFPPNQRQKLFANYEMVKARILVKEGIFLDIAEKFFTQLLRGRFPKITIINCVYQLGLIAYKKGDYELSKKRLLAVTENGKNLNIVKKANVLLEKIETSKLEKPL